MHNATMEFGRSIPKKQADALTRALKPGLPPGALVVKYWRNAIWVERRDDHVHRDQRLKVVANERRADLALKEVGELRRSSRLSQNSQAASVRAITDGSMSSMSQTTANAISQRSFHLIHLIGHGHASGAGANRYP
jgi:hypothetical protein